MGDEAAGPVRALDPGAGLMAVVTPLDVLETYRTSSIREADLIDGYAGAVVVQPCACGGFISAHETRRAIAYAVWTHNNGERHDEWAKANGWRHA